MNQDKGVIIYCPRCGAEMYSNSRYCMKCGNLNYEHEENKSMRPYINEESQGFEMSGGKFIGGGMRKKMVGSIVGNRVGNPLIPFLFLYLIFLFIIGISGYFFFKQVDFDILSISSTLFPLIAIFSSLIALYLYSFALLFMKTNRPWWGAFIPIYNLMVLADIAFDKSFLGILCLIPVIGQILMLVMFYRIGNYFQYNGFLTAIFSFIMIPVIGFGGHPFKEVHYISSEEHALEKNYKRKKIFLVTFLFFLLLGVSLFVLGNSDKVSKGSSITNYYYVHISNRLVKKARKSIENGTVNCSDSAFVSGSGVYYFYYADVSDAIFMPFAVFTDPISAYVKVDFNMGEAKYYVSLTDEKKGFAETLYEDITTDTVIDYTELTLDYNNVNHCYFD